MPTPTPVTAAELAERIGTTASPRVEACLATAVEMLQEALIGAFRPMPENTYRECVLSVGYAVWDRKKSSAGSKQQTTMEGQIPVRSPRDPMASVGPILAKYVAGFA